MSDVIVPTSFKPGSWHDGRKTQIPCPNCSTRSADGPKGLRQSTCILHLRLSGESVAGWSGDARAILVFRGTEIPLRIERVDLATGRREMFREIGPVDRSGFLQIEQVSLAASATAYAYGLVRRTSQLYLVKGAR